MVVAKAEGSTTRRSLGTFATRADAEKAERSALALRDRGIDLAPQFITVAEIVQRYLRDRNTRCETKTMEEYEKIASSYILPKLGSKPIAKLRPAHISEWQHSLAESGGQGGRALSAKTTFHARSFLSAALKWACKMQMLVVNPCDAVDAPKVRRSDAKALSTAEVSQLIQTCKGSSWNIFVILALTLGARRGELLAIRWEHVDFECKTVTLEGSLSQTKDCVALKGTKTDRTRTVPLSRPALEVLHRQRARQAADKLRAGGIYDDQGWVFANELGSWLTPKSATAAYARIAQKAGISSTRLHDLRHTAATTLLVSGIDVRTVAGILGHSTATTTLSTYAHLLADSQRIAVERLGDAFDAITQETVETSRR